jgi:hypothetical protein
MENVQPKRVLVKKLERLPTSIVLYVDQLYDNIVLCNEPKQEDKDRIPPEDTKCDVYFNGTTTIDNQLCIVVNKIMWYSMKLKDSFVFKSRESIKKIDYTKFEKPTILKGSIKYLYD